MSWRIECWNVTQTPWPVAEESVQCVVTSPPYWGLRDYGVSGQVGLELTFDEYIEKMVAVFREVRRVLRVDGTVWLNLGDCYATGAGRAFSPGGGKQGEAYKAMGAQVPDSKNPNSGIPIYQPNRMPQVGLKPKDLVGIPWRVAFALQADGWWLRSDIVWAKPNPMPESITDRPTRAHEYVFLLTKARRYFYNADAIRSEAPAGVSKMPDGWATHEGGHGSFHRNGREKGARTDKKRGHGRRHNGFNDHWDALSKDEQQAQGANARSVWTIATEPYPEAHFATFPTELARRCILAGSRPGDLILDPFSGSGTVVLVADTLGRGAIGLELKEEYVEMARRRVEAPRTESEAKRRGREDAGQLTMYPIGGY